MHVLEINSDFIADTNGCNGGAGQDFAVGAHSVTERDVLLGCGEFCCQENGCFSYCRVKVDLFGVNFVFALYDNV